ncbi:MAG: glutathione S-transferase N-terminal domain-containing protein [Patescibacteria group bacterium]
MTELRQQRRMTNITLYAKTGCPYCAMVIHKLEELNMTWEEKNIANDEVAKDLIARGGKRQVPYIIDKEKGVEMYESADIVDYLEKNYGKKIS